MPIRFQVDGDFYDHPKTYGMSDAAVALWTRAGSYSAAKLTDGFIAEHVLALLSQTPQEAADELKRRGLWSRVKGGYQFHQWAERNLTKARVQADQQADRERKKASRKARKTEVTGEFPQPVDKSYPQAGSDSKPTTQNVNPQADTQNVRPESERNPDGIQAESERIPDVSVSVSVSGSVSESGRDAVHGPPSIGDEPPPQCPQHLEDQYPPPCGACATARRANERWHQAWEAGRAERERLAPKCATHPGKLAANCPLCRADELAAH